MAKERLSDKLYRLRDYAEDLEKEIRNSETVSPQALSDLQEAATYLHDSAEAQEYYEGECEGLILTVRADEIVSSQQMTAPGNLKFVWTNSTAAQEGTPKCSGYKYPDCCPINGEYNKDQAACIECIEDQEQAMCECFLEGFGLKKEPYKTN